MWKEGSANPANATDFKDVSQANQNGFDANYNTSLYLSLASSVLDIVVIVLGWGPFGKWYQYQADLAAAPEEEEEAKSTLLRMRTTLTAVMQMASMCTATSAPPQNTEKLRDGPYEK